MNAVKTKHKPVLESFDFADTTLGDGLIKDVVVNAMKQFYAVPNDDIMYYCRLDAGFPTEAGRAYGGWWENWRSHVQLGQWMTAFSRMFAAAGEEKYREKAVFLVEEFWRCFKAAPKKVVKPDYHYGYEKEMLALIDNYVYCGNKNAFNYVKEFVDYGYDNIERSRLFGNNGDEWYTLSESIYKAYLLTGYEKALEFAKMWEYHDFWDMFERGADPFTRKPEAGLFSEFYHAYSHVNTFNSACLAYEVGGDKKYLDTILKFYAWLSDTQLYPSGGFGAEYEHFMPRDRIAAAFRNPELKDHFETQCDSYAAYRLTKYLTEFTGEARFSDWSEKMIYNATAACLPMTENGNIMYYSNYNTGGAVKENRADRWTCCTGSRPLLVMELQRLIYYTGGGDLYVAQFIPSALEWRRQSGTCGVRMETPFPRGGGVRITVNPFSSEKFTVNIRKPDWARKKFDIRVNGVKTPYRAKGGWLAVNRVWNGGDVIEFDLPVEFKLHKLNAEPDAPSCIMYGPVLMALQPYMDLPENLRHWTYFCLKK